MKKKFAVNPYLPFWETIPDAEPHVFGDRVYIFGSHDTLGGNRFCSEDYACWSAPLDNLGDWKYEGIIYPKEQDPLNGASYSNTLPKLSGAAQTIPVHDLYAPDVAKGPDGRYYLYYALDFTNVISVAVCDTPAGSYEFLDFVRYADGSIRNNARYFDPAILCDSTGNYLYYGFCPESRFPGMETSPYPGAMMVKLADDMHTIITEPVLVANGIETAAGSSYEKHPFFEAPSIRHYGDWYYFIYSSIYMHELCYGMSQSPEGPFEYKGILVSNANLGCKGNTQPQNYFANNHGGLVHINGKYFIFWHRHTMATQFSRQGCADKVCISEDGTISQAEITSCGLSDEPLPAAACYQAQIACHLTGPVSEKVGLVPASPPGQPPVSIPEDMPYITVENAIGLEKGMRSYIYNLQKGAAVGFKYLTFSGNETSVDLLLRGCGKIDILKDSVKGEKIASVQVDHSDWQSCIGSCQITPGIHAVYFVIMDGCVDFSEFEFKKLLST